MTVSSLESGDQVAVGCPACSPDSEELHEVLKPDGDTTVRCRSCGHVHKVTIEESSREETRVVVSSGGDSIRTTAMVPTDEVLAVGEEFVADTEDGLMGVRITSLEGHDGERVESAEGADVSTIWTRAVDNLGVPVTIHPADGRREGTVSETYYLPGDEPITVGDSMPLSDDTVRVERILLRDDVIHDGVDKLEHTGDEAVAKDVKRVFGRRIGEDTWRSPWE